MSRKIVAAIRETRHTSIHEVEAVLADLGDVSKADVLRGLEALLEPTTLTSEPYKLACSFFVGVVQHCPDRALFAPLAKALPKAPHNHAREAIVKALPLVNNIAEHALVVAHLRHSDENVRAAALRIIEKIVVAATIEALAHDAKSGTFHPQATRTWVLLVDKLGARASPVLLAAIGNVDARMVIAGFDAAARTGTVLPERHSFVAAAKARMRDSDDEIAAAAAQCFAALATDEISFVEGVAPVLELGGPRAVSAALRGVLRFPSPRMLSILEQRLMRGPSRVSLAALRVLQDIATDDVLPPLVAAIAHRRQRVRTDAVRVLKALAAEAKVDIARAILFLLRSRDHNVRRMASEVLQAMSGSGAMIWPRLVTFIRDEDWWVRERLVDALVPMAGSSLIPHVVPFLDDDTPGMRRFAVQTLGRIGDGQALGALLIRARDDEDWLVREEAVRAIGQVGDARAVPYLVKLLDADGLAIACLDSLRKLKRDDARDKLPVLLARPERDVRMAALRYAQTVEASEVIENVAALLADSDPEIARAAAATLRAWHYGGAADPALDEASRVLAGLLKKVVVSGASDLILMSGQPASMKVNGRVERVTQRELTAGNVYDLLQGLLLPEHVETLAKRVDVDFSHEDRRVGGRFRVNAFQGEGGLGAVFRVVKSDVVPLENLGVPEVVKGLAELESGLVLFGGPPGSGKSTTLAGIIHRINQTQSRHIVCIEDPIEAVHASAQSLVTQRELGVHTFSYGAALRAALREDPDVILVGELRDLETIGFAVSAAETGHLVFGTVHAVSADNCVERVINAFPHDRQAQIRTMLSDTLRAIVCQHLLPRRDGGRALACEVMLNSDSIANLIRKGQAHQIVSQMLLQREIGMRLMDDSLAELVDKGIIDSADAYVKARDKSRFPVADTAVPVREAPVAAPAKVVSAPMPVAPGPPPSPAPAPSSMANAWNLTASKGSAPASTNARPSAPTTPPTPAKPSAPMTASASPRAAAVALPVVPVVNARASIASDAVSDDDDEALFEDSVPPVAVGEAIDDATAKNPEVSPSGVRPAMKHPRKF